MVSEDEAKVLNKKGFGIFHTVNDFDWTKVSKFKGRSVENVTRILFWTAESDHLDKKRQIKKANEFLPPTVVVESKNSMHFYWQAVDGTLENYKKIQLKLAELFEGDTSLQHPAHTLRAPGYYHWKNPDDPFLVQRVHFCQDDIYAEKFMLRVLERRAPTKAPTKKQQKSLSFDGDGFWQRLDAMNQGELLQRMSGFEGETIEVIGRQIFVNGEKCNAWIDEEGRLGGHHGPTVYGWIRYFGHSKQRAIEILKNYFPELEKEDV